MEIEKAPALTRKRVGLALSSGAARGLAHIGVLEVMEREGIPIDMIAGTSAGALVGALYARIRDAGQTKKLIADLISKRLIFLRDLGLPKTGLIQGKKFKGWLRSMIGDIEFDDLSIPFACVATDIVTGEEVVIKKGSVVEAVRASVSLPAIVTLVKWEGRYLVDGGLVNPVPVSVLREMGADFIIAVNVVPDIRDRTKISKANVEKKEDPKEPNIFSIIMRMVHITAYQAVKSSLQGADIVIEPEVVEVGFGDFHRVNECVLQGQLAAQSSIPEIKRRLEI